MSIKLSILIPAYNEEKTIHLILDKVKDVQLSEGTTKEIIIVNDCSLLHIHVQGICRMKGSSLCKRMVNYGDPLEVCSSVRCTVINIPVDNYW